MTRDMLIEKGKPKPNICQQRHEERDKLDQPNDKQSFTAGFA